MEASSIGRTADRMKGLAHHKLPPEFFQLGAGRRRQMPAAAIANASATDASGAATSASGPSPVLSTSQLLQLPRQLLDLRHRQRQLLLLLVEQRPDAVQVRGCEQETVSRKTLETERKRRKRLFYTSSQLTSMK